MEKDTFTLECNVIAKLFDKDGNLKEIRRVHNTVTAAGKAGILDQSLAAPSLPKMGWVELGTGVGGTTKLTSYIAGSRTAFTTKTRAANAVTVSAFFGPGVGTGSITELGTFDTATQDTANMWMYATWAALPKGALDSITIDWELTGN